MTEEGSVSSTTHAEHNACMVLMGGFFYSASLLLEIQKNISLVKHKLTATVCLFHLISNAIKMLVDLVRLSLKLDEIIPGLW